MRSPARGRAFFRRRPLRIPGARKETLVVLVMLAAAAGAAWLALRALEPRSGGAPPRGTDRPGQVGGGSILPERIPYEDLVRGMVRRLGGGRVEIFYDFEAIPRVEGRSFTDVDLYPQLEDWNLSLPDSRTRTGVVRGEGRLLGEARTRLAFAGPVEVSLDVEIVSGSAAILLATDRSGDGLEFLIDGASGACRSRLRREGETREIAWESVETGEQGPVVGRTLAVTLSLSDRELHAGLEGRWRSRALLPPGSLRREGNIALRSPNGRVLWDNVRIRGELSRRWLEERLHTALALLGPDEFEPDDSWTYSREILAGGSDQSRTFWPERDVDWVSVAIPPGAGAVIVSTHSLHLGVTTVLDVFEADGRTPIGTSRPEVSESGAAAALVPAEGRRAFYVRIAEAGGRRGTYSLSAGVVRAGQETVQ